MNSKIKKLHDFNKFCEKIIFKLKDDNIFTKDDRGAALTLLSALLVGTKRKTLEEEVTEYGYSKEEFGKYYDNIIKGGVFKGKNINSDWHHEETGYLSFILDLLVARGMAQRTVLI